MLLTLLAPEDLVGNYRGEWWVSTSNLLGTIVLPSASTRLWARWADISWDTLAQGDFNGDRRTDVVGHYDGTWYVGLSNGNVYETSLWGNWGGISTNFENFLVGDLNHDGRDDVVASVGGLWYASLSTGSSFEAPSLWTVTVDADWSHTFLTDYTGDGRDDLVLAIGGSVFGAASNGGGFATAGVIASLGNLPGQSLMFGEFDADGRQDLYVFRNGTWLVGVSNGTVLNVRTVAQWSTAAAWEDPVIADIDPVGNRHSVFARTRGAWYVGLNVPVATPLLSTIVTDPLPWERWLDVDWEDVRVGDFSGDGLDDLAGRHLGEWYVTNNVTLGIVTNRFAKWVDVDWRGVGPAQADNPNAAILPPILTGPNVPASAAAFTVAPPEDDPLALFWSQAEEDEDLSHRLLAI